MELSLGLSAPQYILCHSPTLRTTLCQVDFVTQYCQKNEIILYFLLWLSIISLDLLPSAFTNLLERCQTWVIGISHYRRKMMQ